jgi:hypothetical protein
MLAIDEHLHFAIPERIKKRAKDGARIIATKMLK